MRFQGRGFLSSIELRRLLNHPVPIEFQLNLANTELFPFDHVSDDQQRGGRDAGERRIAAIARADDAGPLRIDDALPRQLGQPVRDVGLHLAAPLAMPGLLEGGAETGRSAEIGLEHRIAARRERLLAAGVDVSEMRRGMRLGTTVATVRSGTAGVPTPLLQVDGAAG